MSKRHSAERAEFLGDVLGTALEGGIGYWSAASEIHRVGDYPHGDWQYSAVTLFEVGDGDTTCSVTNADCEGHRVDLDSVARGIAALLAPGRTYRHRVLLAHANRHNDAGDIDADIADDIVQCAALGSLVYG